MGPASWGSNGDPTKWYVDFGMIKEGDEVDLVANIVSFCGVESSALVTLYPCSTKARIVGLSEPTVDSDFISVFGAVYIGLMGVPTFAVREVSLEMAFPKPNHDDLLGLNEACAGMGFATEGFQQAGFQPRTATEWRESLASAYKHRHPDVHVVVGDVGTPKAVWEMWKANKRVCPIFAGFSCQPFSRGGAQKGGEDSRANSLTSTIKAAFMLRAPIIVLECVKDACHNNFVLQTLNDFCSQCRFHRTETVLALEQCWAGKRERWWTVLTAPFLGPIKLRPFPSIPFPSQLHQIHPCIRLTADEISQLELLHEEYAAFIQYVGDIRCMLPQWNSRAPTALHSWGSQLSSCPCGCRSMSFSPQTLSRGTYGRLIQMDGFIEVNGKQLPRMRHPHPIEVAIWNCMLPKDDWSVNLKLLLCGLGQMAIPLQSSWVACQIRQHLDLLLWGKSEIDCDEKFEQTRMAVMQFVQASKKVEPPVVVDTASRVLPVEDRSRVDEHVEESIEHDVPMVEDIPTFSQAVADEFPAWVGTPHLGDASSFTLVVEGEGIRSQIAISHPQSACVGQVIAAEVGLNATSGYLSLVDCITQDELSHDQLVAGRSLCLQEEKGPWSPEGFECDWDGYGVDFDPTPEVEMHDITPTIPFRVVEEAMTGTEEVVDAAPAPDYQVVPKSDPLCFLSAEQLLKVDPPRVSSVEVLQSLLQQTISTEDREQIVSNQGSVWADDEVRFHLETILQHANKPHIGFMDPLLVSELMGKLSCAVVQSWWKSFIQTPTVIVGLACFNGHWIPFQCNWTADCFFVASWDDGPGQFPKCLRDVCDLLCKHVGSRTVQIRIEHRRFPTNNHCGVCAVRFIDHVVRGRMLPDAFHEVRVLHEKGRQMFVDFLRTQSSVPRPWQWGAGLDQPSLSRLHDLLRQHGVPDNQLATRTHLITQMLGVQDLQGALQGSTAWRALKSLANKCHPPLQLVLADELNVQIQKRAKEGKVGAKRSKQKSGGDKQLQFGPPKLDPSKVLLDKGVFAKPDGTPLTQLPLEAIGAFAEGIVLGTLADGLAYLQAGQPVNNLCLGFFIVNASSEEIATRLSCVEVRIPLRCIANGEPMLVSGYLVQLGSQQIVLNQAKPIVDIEAPAACCVKVAVYRDSIEGSWTDFCKGPIKYLINHIPALASCNDATGMDCQCPRWHPPSGSQLTDPILDVWRRQWVTLQFRPTTMEAADMFLVNFRCVADQEVSLLGLSGTYGVHVEPRSLDAKEPNTAYQVIWLSSVPMAEAVRLKQCNPLVLGIARLGSRLGLRAKVEDAEEVGKAVRPGAIILGTGPDHCPLGWTGFLSVACVLLGDGRQNPSTPFVGSMANKGLFGLSKPMKLQPRMSFP